MQDTIRYTGVEKVIPVLADMECRPVLTAPNDTGIQVSTSAIITAPQVAAAQSIYAHKEALNGLIDGKNTGGAVYFAMKIYAIDSGANTDDLDWAPAIRNKDGTWAYPLDIMSTTKSNERTLAGADVDAGVYDVITGWIPTVAQFNLTEFDLGIWALALNATTTIALVSGTIVLAKYVPGIVAEKVT